MAHSCPQGLFLALLLLCLAGKVQSFIGNPIASSLLGKRLASAETISPFSPSVKPRVASSSASILDLSMAQGKVMIVGAGPAGLLSAHFLLRRGYDVTIAERRNDPREGSNPSLRSYSLGLGVRGRGAIRAVGDDLWEKVKERGVMSQRFCLHIGKRVLDIRQKSSSLLKTEPSCLINRADLCSALLQGLEDSQSVGGGDRGKLKLVFGQACEGVDLAAKTVKLSGGVESYDLLIAADGVGSAVRSAVIEAVPEFKYASAPLNGTQKILHQEMPGDLDPNAVHAMSGSYAKGERLGFFWVPERNRTTGGQQGCVLVNWEDSSAPKALLEAKTAEEVRDLLNKAFPRLGKSKDDPEDDKTVGNGITLDAARQFLEQSSSINTVNKCNSYHSSMGSVLLLGDAAHSSGGASGQGCNAALQDAQVFDQILSEVNDDLKSALPLYSTRRVPEGHALLDLSINQSPKAPPLRALFLLFSFMETLGHSLLPSLVNPPTQNLLTQTDWSFSKIYELADKLHDSNPKKQSKKVALDFIKKSNEKYGVFTGY